ncbi:hypothetical protein F972_01470 [Acinetobacter sp. CIP 102529]|uniref:hypothetical protein n=1 Tax=Acinetobacter sp. CIP 102529 TaxID=1144668 RepID=UPI0002D105AF|nr:hypothetical protein [Acinetobacter sp. CIP 102529]ENU89215.1 hypothetical protein F972_01470 [Acinetobacter sp. CIP 102529]
MLVRPKKPSREELAKIFKDPRTLKAFEQVFEILPGEINIQQESIDDVQALAESAAAQAVLAIALIQAVEALAEVKAMEPVRQCNCQHDDLTPRYEHATPDHIEPTQIQYQEINSLEVI